MIQKRSAQEREDTNAFHAFSLIHLSQTTYEDRHYPKSGDTASDAATDGYIMCSYSFSTVHQTSPAVTLPSSFPLNGMSSLPKWYRRHAFRLHGRVYHTKTLILEAWRHKGNWEQSIVCCSVTHYHPKSLLFGPETRPRWKYTLCTSKPYSLPGDTLLSSGLLTAFKRKG